MPATIRDVTGPSLAKARAHPLVVIRRTVLLRAGEPPWRDLFDRADTVSEGGVREEESGRVWYGTTSLILSTPTEDLALLTLVASRDVHVRLRALRAAHREACSRAPSRLGRISCEMRFAADAKGVRIDVDVQAPLIERHTVAR
jgi:hypothetical protein